MIEKRKHVRLDVISDVVYAIITEGDTRFRTISKNISCGGLQVFLRELTPVQTVLNLEIYLPVDKKPIHATGRVAWQETESDHNKGNLSTGLQFIEISDEDKGKIANYVLDGVKRQRLDDKLSLWQKLKTLFS
ncbi:MAG: PilZ domain-containing protein [Candidatus Omnitrophica bacterium]|nr:PilZ domain-containing protein [Candidatus Omnitrophota bacterium]